ncbi:MAG: hypothetical protein SU899_01110 [Chloroflexota bacterium]|nr:hypothetical protein [Chloroflexota bacterium]
MTDSDAGFMGIGSYTDQPSRIQVMVNMFSLAERQSENKAALQYLFKIMLHSRNGDHKVR